MQISVFMMNNMSKVTFIIHNRLTTLLSMTSTVATNPSGTCTALKEDGPRPPKIVTVATGRLVNLTQRKLVMR